MAQPMNRQQQQIPFMRGGGFRGNRFMQQKERPKNFSSTIKRLLSYFRGQQHVLLLIFILSLGASAGALAGPFVIGQIGELAKVVSDELQAATPHINWSGMKGLRNRIVHEYENVDLRMLWAVIKTDLPTLRLQLEEMLDHGDQNGSE